MSALALTLTKDASVFFDAVSDGSLLEMTYLCSHEGGNIDVKMKDIGKEDVVRVLGVVMGVLMDNKIGNFKTKSIV